jgi:hypothetical protein
MDLMQQFEELVVFPTGPGHLFAEEETWVESIRELRYHDTARHPNSQYS